MIDHGTDTEGKSTAAAMLDLGEQIVAGVREAVEEPGESIDPNARNRASLVAALRGLQVFAGANSIDWRDALATADALAGVEV